MKGVEYDNRSTTVIRIQITNVNEPPEFTDDIYEVNVKENVTVGTTLIEMKAEDPEGKDIRYQHRDDEQFHFLPLASYVFFCIFWQIR